MNDTKKLYGNSALHEAACAGDVQAVTDLLNILADVNARNKDDETPLHLATLRNQTDTIKLLIAAQADVAAVN